MDMEDPSSLKELADDLINEYQILGNIKDLQEAIVLRRKVLTHYPPDDPHRADALNNLAVNLRALFNKLGSIENLEEAISLGREVLTIHTPGHPDRSSSLHTLASNIRNRYKRSGEIGDLEEAIVLDREALTLRPLGHPYRSNSLKNLTINLSTRYNKLGNVEDIEEIILLDREALILCPPGHPARSDSLNSLAFDLRTRYDISGGIENLEEAISLSREVLTIHAADHRDRSSSLYTLASNLRNRYKKSGEIGDLKEAILLDREALTLRPLGHPDRPGSLSNLAINLRMRFDKLGNIEDIEEAIMVDREVVTLRPPGHSGRAAVLNQLGIDLSSRYNKLGNIEDIEEAIALDREALTLRPPGHPRHSDSLINLAIDLRIQYRRVGNIEDIAEAILLAREGLTHHHPGDRHHSDSLDNLALGLWNQYEQIGNIEGLEEAISLTRDALKLYSACHPDRSRILGNLAIYLWARHQRLGKKEDLEDSISLSREALTLRPIGHPRRSTSLGNLADALIARYHQLGNIEDREKATLLNRQALALCPPGHADRSRFLSSLADALRTLYNSSYEQEHSGKVLADLQESISLEREALTLRPLGNPKRSTSLVNLSIGLSTRYERLRNMEDLAESIDINREALGLRWPGHAGYSESLANLANVLLPRYQMFGKVEDMEEIITCYDRAAGDSTSYLKDRLMASIKWAQVARDNQHESMLNAYTISLQLLHRSLISRPDVNDQHGFLATAKIPRSFASDAASAAIQAGNLELAVEFLEQGRAMLWSRIDAYKYPLEELRRVEGGEALADQLETLSAELERLVLLSDRTATLDDKSSTGGVLLDARIKRHRVLSEEWDDLVRTIREKPGFTHFLKTPPFGTLKSAATHGPVILINISNYRSDAIILTTGINNPPITLVPLPDVKLDDLRDHACQLKDKHCGVLSVLRYLWKVIVSPVVVCLRELGVKKKSRIWWCPTAELCALPLHAAGSYRGDREENLPDIYTSSYTSTLSSLIRARSSIQISKDPELLVVGQPNDETLRNVDEEVKTIEQFSDKVPVKVLVNAEASCDAVLAGMKQHPWAHFACHGHLGPGENAQPFQASFELYGGRRLTLLDLIQARLPHAQFAFLAACNSAAGGTHTPDENIHLSAALQFCGFRSVVGTLWKMIDDDGPTVSKKFYDHMFRKAKHIDFKNAAHALSSAVRAMRRDGLEPERWAMFVHIGA